MDIKFKNEFLNLWGQYFGSAELPIVFFFTDDIGVAELLAKAERAF